MPSDTNKTAMTNSTDAPHTRESELRDLKAKFMAWNVIPDLEGYLKATHGMIPFDWVMDAMRRISTPIPLTPSDGHAALIKQLNNVADVMWEAGNGEIYYDPVRNGKRYMAFHTRPTTPITPQFVIDP